jgi:hypothetical protein
MSPDALEHRLATYVPDHRPQTRAFFWFSDGQVRAAIAAYASFFRLVDLTRALPGPSPCTSCVMIYPPGLCRVTQRPVSIQAGISVARGAASRKN